MTSDLLELHLAPRLVSSDSAIMAYDNQQVCCFPPPTYSPDYQGTPGVGMPFYHHYVLSSLAGFLELNISASTLINAR